MTTQDFITELFCRVDDQMKGMPKHSQALLYPPRTKQRHPKVISLRTWMLRPKAKTIGDESDSFGFLSD